MSLHEIAKSLVSDLKSYIDKRISELPLPEKGDPGDPAELKPYIEDQIKSIHDDAIGKLVQSLEEKTAEIIAKRFDEAGQEIEIKCLAATERIDSKINKSLAEIKPPKDGENGKDALALEILPSIDTEKSYPRGTYAIHKGGLWRAYETTHEMRGWETVVNGVSNIQIRMENQRDFCIEIENSSGPLEKKFFTLPVMIYRQTYKYGESYQKGDVVTFGGSMWHCQNDTDEKPDSNSKSWVLAVKRGKDGRDKANVSNVAGS